MKYVTSVMKSVLSNKKVVQMRCGRKFGRGTIITSVYDYRFNNQLYIFVRNKSFVGFYRTNSFFWCAIWVYLKSLNRCPWNVMLCGSIF